MNILKDVAGENELHFELCRELISIERSYKNELRRHQLFQEMKNPSATYTILKRASNTPKSFPKNKNIKEN